MATLASQRTKYHASLAAALLGGRVRSGSVVTKKVGSTTYHVYTNADSYNHVSVVLADGVAQRLGIKPVPRLGAGSTSGLGFERITREFLTPAMGLFAHLQERDLRTLPGERISNFAQYSHLAEIEKLVKKSPELQVALGGDYIVTPDIVVAFDPFIDNQLNAKGKVVDSKVARRTPVRANNSSLRILHASISCKWTMRRDRAQNTRTEALNLVRNRKGRVPHIAIVTMECDPATLGSLALGTGDIDCVYHGALYELVDAARSASQTLGGRWVKTAESLERMVEGSRLRDISDLPLDLQV